MRAGDLVLTPLPQADGRTKNRPCVALCQMPRFGDWLVCGVSTQLHHAVPGFDDTIASTDPDFAATGLKVPSLIRLGFLAVIPASHLLGSIGSLAPERHGRLLQRLAVHLDRARPEPLEPPPGPRP